MPIAVVPTLLVHVLWLSKWDVVFVVQISWDEAGSTELLPGIVVWFEVDGSTKVAGLIISDCIELATGTCVGTGTEWCMCTGLGCMNTDTSFSTWGCVDIFWVLLSLLGTVSVGFLTYWFSTWSICPSLDNRFAPTYWPHSGSSSRMTVQSCISFAGYTIFTLVLGLLHKLLEFPVGSLGQLRDWCHVNDVRCS